MRSLLKRFILLFLIIQFSTYSFSQSDSVVYFVDKDEKLCSKEKAVYVVRGVTEKEKFKLSYFVVATGNLVMETTYTDYTLAIKDGFFARYDEESQKILKKGYYANNLENGYWIYWNHGYLTDSILYENGKDIIRISYSYHNNGVLSSRTMNNFKIKTTELSFYNEEANLVRNTRWINGTGDQIYYYPNGQVKTIEKYKDKKIVSTKNYNPDGTEISEKKPKKNKERIADNKNQVVGGSPSYPGGSAGFESFFRRNFKQPESLGREGFSESVTVTFYLDKSGFANNIRVSGARNRDIEIEVLAVFRRMAAWTMNGHQSFGPITYTINL